MTLVAPFGKAGCHKIKDRSREENFRKDSLTEMLYLYDHYLREFEAAIIEIPDLRSVVLDRTALYPRGGGQPSDKGELFLAEKRIPSGRILKRIGTDHSPIKRASV